MANNNNDSGINTMPSLGGFRNSKEFNDSKYGFGGAK